MKKNKKKQQQQSLTRELGLNENDMQKTIVNALIQYDEEKEKRAREKAKEDEDNKKNYLNQLTIGQIIKRFLEVCSYAFMTPRKLHDLNEKIEGVKNTLLVFTVAMTTVFSYISVGLLFWGAYNVYACVKSIIEGNYMAAVLNVLFIPIKLLFAGVFRCVSIEIEKTDDYDFVFGLFSSIVAVVSLLISLVALSKGI